ncbi:hypothetical protein [Nocardioides humi]|uniref:NIPSNAP protein n=1 Tax=Nocardioides humi TaxID=449461 RepID=A0ABN2ACJ9_9ACTN|nr:hypothetical protein [Nocardioides humi]
MKATAVEQEGAHDWFHVIRFRYGGPEEQRADWQAWLEDVHIPAVLAVPGMRSYTRYGQLGSDRDFLTVWQLDGPHVFDEPAYAAARGWGPWEGQMEHWTISLLQSQRPPRRFGTAGPRSAPL